MRRALCGFRRLGCSGFSFERWRWWLVVVCWAALPQRARFGQLALHDQLAPVRVSHHGTAVRESLMPRFAFTAVVLVTVHANVPSASRRFQHGSPHSESPTFDRIVAIPSARFPIA